MSASEQGVDRQRYMLMPRTLIFLTRGNEVLLLKGAPHKRLWAGLYNGVGGHIEKGEDVLSAAKRELQEETGITLPELWFCGTITVDTQENPGVCIFVFKGSYSRDETPKSTDGTLEWLKIDQIYQLPLVSDLSVLLPKVLNMRPGQAPFSAHSNYNEAGEMVISFTR